MTPSLKLFEKGDDLPYDHFAFRTLKMAGGINIFTPFLVRHGYQRMENYSFPSKRLAATWFKHAHFPRIFISELHDVDLTLKAQSILARNLNASHFIASPPFMPNDSESPLPSMTVDELSYLQRESDYAAWVLVHGNRLNHVALPTDDIIRFVSKLEVEKGIKTLGKIQISNDSLLLQTSIVADPFPVLLRDTRFDETDMKECIIGGGFVEFIERRRGRDGFEPENALQIFSSTDVTNKR